jgi:hypothetical protein
MPRGKGVPDKNIEVDGKVIGGQSLIRLNVKTALWIIGGIFSIVMTILTYSYFDLKKAVKADQEAKDLAHKEFIEKVDGKLDKFDDDVQTIRIDQATIRGDIRLILDRQNRDNPVRTNANVSVQPVVPPPTSSDTIQ